MEHSGLISMLRDDKIEDLSRMYTLFGRVPNGHALMREVISTYVKDTVCHGSLVGTYLICRFRVRLS